MTIEVGDAAALRLVDRLTGILKEEPDPVRQQQAIEILMMSHALRMVDQRDAKFVIDSMAKHAKQLMHP